MRVALPARFDFFEDFGSVHGGLCTSQALCSFEVNAASAVGAKFHFRFQGSKHKSFALRAFKDSCRWHLFGSLPKGFSTHTLITLMEGELRLSGAEKPKLNPRLVDIASGYFKKEGYKVKSDTVSIEGDSGVLRHFDLIVQKGRDEQVVWIRDWNRTIGVNVIIGLDTAAADVKMPNPIMIGEKFSDHAKSYSNRRKITLLTKQKLTTSFR